MTPASQGSLTQNCHEKIKQNSHIIVILWELVKLPLPYFTHLLIVIYSNFDFAMKIFRQMIYEILIRISTLHAFYFPSHPLGRKVLINDYFRMTTKAFSAAAPWEPTTKL